MGARGAVPRCFVMRQKRIAAIHDISGFGKCSLTVVLPILSAAGIETSVMPTAVLSTHTGGLGKCTYRDLTEDMRDYAAHWKSLNLSFDALYTGFLGSAEQIGIVSDIVDDFRTSDTLVMVDPVLADNGKLYATCTPEMAHGMKTLCKKADLIVPNLTEAAFLLGEEFYDGPYDRAYIEGVLHRLSDMGPRLVVLTGVWFSPGLLGAAGLDRDTGRMTYAFSPRIEGAYHGTGDIFGSVLLAGLLNEMSLRDAMQLAVDFTCGSIRRTREAGTDRRFGVNFEAGLPRFMEELGLFPVNYRVAR